VLIANRFRPSKPHNNKPHRSDSNSSYHILVDILIHPLVRTTQAGERQAAARLHHIHHDSQQPQLENHDGDFTDRRGMPRGYTMPLATRRHRRGHLCAVARQISGPVSLSFKRLGRHARLGRLPGSLLPSRQPPPKP
jgi:hypothetical protein